MTEAATEIGRMSFEEALEELEAIVRQLEAGKGRLDDAITSYERGAALKAHCEKKLSQAKEKVEKITLTASGAVSAQPHVVE
ncbi:MAG TPA: exodeoxyribonuclease VII small subunit [Stellaceae bacterium]|nr:exodeoxyribonuclease VII small subunit [Stellaceae bacterium]